MKTALVFVACFALGVLIARLEQVLVARFTKRLTRPRP